MATLRVPTQPIIKPHPCVLHRSSRTSGWTRSTMSSKAFPRYGRGETTSAVLKTSVRKETWQLLHYQTSHVGKHPQHFNGHQQSKVKKIKKYNQWMRRDVRSAWQTRRSYPAARTGPPPTDTMLAIFFGSSTSLCWFPICTSCTKYNTK